MQPLVLLYFRSRVQPLVKKSSSDTVIKLLVMTSIQMSDENDQYSGQKHA